MKEQKVNLWHLGNCLWAQDESGSFLLHTYNDRAIHPVWRNREGAKFAGAAYDAKGNVFPGSFVYSPDLGRDGGKLTRGAEMFEASLPPYAQQAGDPAGIAETSCALAIEGLNNKAEADVRPARTLPLPSYGRHHFVVGNFGLTAPMLFSYDLSSGSIHSWIPHENKWLEFASENRGLIAPYSRPDLTWSMHALDLAHSGVIFLPTDSGIVRVELNPLSLTYRVDYLSSLPCIAGVIEFQGDLFGLVLAEDGSAKVVQLPLGETAGTVRVHEVPDLKGSNISQIRSPFKSKREMYWLSDQGQIRVKQEGTAESGFAVSMIAWPVQVIPKFMLGGAYVHSDGRMWQQCMDVSSADSDEHGYCFVELGKEKPERKAVGNYRLLGGHSCLIKDQRLVNQPPWNVPSNNTGSILRITVPLLEANVGTKPMICFSAAFAADPDEFFANDGIIDVEYSFWGHLPSAPNHRCVFHFSRVATPWDTRVFVYDGYLFLYDPDSRDPVHGWKLTRSNQVSD